MKPRLQTRRKEAMATEVQRQVLDEDAALREIVRRIADAYHPLRIYLFGSKARGTAGSDSDYDLLVVVPDDAPPELKKSKLAYRALWGVSKSKDVLVCTDGWFRSRERLDSSLPATVNREGKLLYAA
jgi:predicted nucleotidyltransferase